MFTCMFRLCDFFYQFSPLGICEPVDSEHCMNQNYWLDCNSMLPFECEAFEDPGKNVCLYDYMKSTQRPVPQKKVLPAKFHLAWKF